MLIGEDSIEKLFPHLLMPIEQFNARDTRGEGDSCTVEEIGNTLFVEVHYKPIDFRTLTL